MNRFHIISIGDFTMCNLAIALHKKGYQVSGSYEEIGPKQLEMLLKHNLLPSTKGWNSGQISKEIDAVIPAMNIDFSNPELQAANDLGIQVLAFPNLIYQESKKKVRLVVSGSKGKSSVISMMIFALKKFKVLFDYASLGPVAGSEHSIQLSYDARIAILEGNEYSVSPIKPKHLHKYYHPQIVVLTNLIWEKSSEFGSFDEYLSSFKELVNGIDRDGKYIYFEEDEPLQNLTANLREDITPMPYKSHTTEEVDGKTLLKTRFGDFPICVRDEFFLQNLNAARIACRQLGLQDKDFYTAISEYSFLNV